MPSNITSKTPVQHPLIDDVLPESIRPLLRSGASSTSVGQSTHAAAAILCPVAASLHPDSLTEAILIVARALCAPGRMHRRNSTLVAGFAAEYLRGPIRPRSPWQFMGAEIPVGNGRADVSWRNDVTGAVIFDEVKTTEVTRSVADRAWVDQCRRYATAGVRRYGDAFLGVRLLPLGSMNTAAFVTATGDLLPLSPTGEDPLAMSGVVMPS